MERRQTWENLRKVREETGDSVCIECFSSERPRIIGVQSFGLGAEFGPRISFRPLGGTRSPTSQSQAIVHTG